MEPKTIRFRSMGVVSIPPRSIPTFQKPSSLGWSTLQITEYHLNNKKYCLSVITILLLMIWMSELFCHNMSFELDCVYYQECPIIIIPVLNFSNDYINPDSFKHAPKARKKLGYLYSDFCFFFREKTRLTRYSINSINSSFWKVRKTRLTRYFIFSAAEGRRFD